ncbi:MAG: C40 family peptidase [Candidatus Aminicenantes bacterium]|nr:MAG: C40 family peptidase [Candidatus Aminicenantes bacterium]
MKLTESLEGLPYKYGGYELNGFDCSGLVYYVYDCFGIKLPRTAKKQAKLKEKISLKRAKPGDILAFKLRSGWHTAIFIGGKSFIHAPRRRDNVRKEALDSFWKKRLKKVIRIIKD